MAESILARAEKLTSDLNRIEASMAVNNENKESNGGRENNNGTAHENYIGDIVGSSDSNNNNNNGGAQCAVSMNDLVEIVKRQQSLIVDMAASVNATANGRMATKLDTQEDTAGKLQLQHHHRGEDMKRASDLHLLLSQLHQHHTVDVKSSDDNIANGNNNETTTNNAKSVMKDHWRVLIVTIGCAIVLALAIGLGARRNNNNSEFLGGGGDGGE